MWPPLLLLLHVVFGWGLPKYALTYLPVIALRYLPRPDDLVLRLPPRLDVQVHRAPVRNLHVPVGQPERLTPGPTAILAVSTAEPPRHRRPPLSWLTRAFVTARTRALAERAATRRSDIADAPGYRTRHAA